MKRPKQEKIDYLTPIKQERMHQESLRGDYSVDFQKTWQKAKMKSILAIR